MNSKFLFILFVFASFIVGTSCNFSSSKQKSIIKYRFDQNLSESCELITKDNCYLWCNDSLGMLGFRRLFSPMLLRNCNLKGMNWNDLSEFFKSPYRMNPSTTYNNINAASYTYLIFMDYESKDPLRSAKSQFLKIYVNSRDSTIIYLQLYYND